MERRRKWHQLLVTFQTPNTCTMAKKWLPGRSERERDVAAQVFSSFTTRGLQKKNCTHLKNTHTAQTHTHTQVAWEVTLCASLSNGHSNSNWRTESRQIRSPRSEKSPGHSTPLSPVAIRSPSSGGNINQERSTPPACQLEFLSFESFFVVVF